MKDFVFIHGKHGKLSAYELNTLFANAVQFQNDYLSIIQLESVDQQLLNTLGGTIKISEIIKDPLEVLLQVESNKILFGLSLYGRAGQMSTHLKKLKGELKEHDRPCRFINKNYQNISSGLLNKSELINKGLDLVLTHVKERNLWSKTLLFQDIDNYSKRDYEKPKRDMKVGMMPPKLIQMMINMAKPNKTTTIYDPFCGLGGTAMETFLRGNPMIGSDIKGRLINSTLKNLEWMVKNFSVDAELLNPNRFYQHDATQPFESRGLPKDMVVVTEGYLGPPLKQFPEEEKGQEIFELLHGINSKFFSKISEVMTPGKRLIMTLPYFRSGKGQVIYPQAYVDQYLKAGFELLNQRRELLYERKQQVVGREVLVFKRS